MRFDAMDCDHARDALSATIDGEDPGVDQAVLDAHVHGCASCQAFAVGAQSLNRAVRVRPAEQVPDLTAAILGPRRAEEEVVHAPVWARYGLLTVALTVLLLSVPSLVSGGGAHDGRDLAAFEVALCAALLVVAWQPRRAAGLVPMAATLAVASLISVGVDVANGEVPIVAEANHVLVLVGLGLLWVIAQPTRGRSAAPAIA